MTLLFLDTNVPMYAIGGQHPLREPSVQIMRIVARQAESFVTDAEVLQEVLHRYFATNRPEQGRQAVRDLAAMMAGRIEAVSADDVRSAADLSSSHGALSARDLLHLAVVRRLSVAHIVTADSGFDGIPNLLRLDPMDVARWAADLGLT